MKIQSVMKNYTVLFQNLPAVLDEDATGVFSNAAAIKTVTDGLLRSESGGADAVTSLHYSDTSHKEHCSGATLTYRKIKRMVECHAINVFGLSR